MIQYTNLSQWGQFIYERGLDNDGTEYRLKTKFEPTLYANTNKTTPYKSLVSNETLAPKKFNSIRDARDWIESEKDVEGKSIHGMDSFLIQYVHERFPESDLKYDLNKVKVWNIDIEVNGENIDGFPHPKDAAAPITAITIFDGDEYHTWGFHEWNDRGKYDHVNYYKCDNEQTLLGKFLQFWIENTPNTITGWNIVNFDMPYIYNRMVNIIGEKVANHLSPFKICNSKTKTINNREISEVNILAVDQLDYLELYKKYTYANQESYRLDHIAHIELGERKLDYSEVKNLHELEKVNYDKFLRYNVKDVELVQKIDDKLKLIDLHMTIAYQAKLGFGDAFSPVKTWDSIIFHHLIGKNVIVPINRHQEKGEYPGAFVKDPIVGFHEWVVSFDLASLYPSLIRQFNISPEMLIEGGVIPSSLDEFINKEVDTSLAHTKDYTLTATGQMYKKDEQGVFPYLMEWLYNQRKATKNMMLDYQKELQTLEKGTDKYEQCSKRVTQSNNQQMAAKILLNSAYGAMGNAWFRYFDLRLASSITLSGQLAIRWIADRLNLYFNKLLKTKDYDYVIAIDTDSTYLRLNNLVNKIFGDRRNTPEEKEKIVNFLDKIAKEQIEPYINESYEELAEYTNSREQLMIMDREGISDKGFWTAKKRYALRVWDNEGVRYATPKVKIMGLDLIKTSTPEKMREQLKGSLGIIFDGTNDEILNYIDDVYTDFKSLKPEDIAFPRSVNGIRKWSEEVNGKIVPKRGCPIHVRGAIIFNQLLESSDEEPITDSEKIKFLYLVEPNYVHSHVLAFRDGIPEYFNLSSMINYDLQFEKTFLQPIKGILTAIGWDWERKASLESFFS